jgi:hypothetical protein
MRHNPNRVTVRTGSIGHPDRQADYVYQAATIVAALLLLLTATVL